MKILFLVFINSTKQDTKKLYINVWVLYIILLSSTTDVNVLQVSFVMYAVNECFYIM